MARPGRRLKCSVLFCKNSRGDRKNDPLPDNIEHTQWVCSRHWMAVPTALRREYGAARKKERHSPIQCTAVTDAEGYLRPSNEPGHCRCHHCLWDICRNRANDIAAGH